MTQNKSSSDTTPETAEKQNEQPDNKDSLGIPVQKSPLFVYALLQIPIVIIMVVILYFAYQNFKPS